MKKILLLVIITSIAMSFTSCSKDESSSSLRIKNNDIKLFKHTEEKLIVENAQGNIVYKSRNHRIATVSDDGVVKGNVRGETYIVAYAGGDSAVCKVTVGTIINVMQEPILDFGKSMEYIKSKIPKNAELVNEEDGTLTYRLTMNNLPVGYVYIFKEGKMVSASLVVSTEKIESATFAKFFVERYLTIDKIAENIYGLASPDEKIYVVIKPVEDDSPLVMAIYSAAKKI